VLASIAESKVFGRQMEREATRRRFFEANAKVFLGDGLPWNWSIWKNHFPDFTPILVQSEQTIFPRFTTCAVCHFV
jgi:hypothetical protein